MKNRFNLQRLHYGIDTIAATVGILVGVVISLINLIHSNVYLLTVGPILIIACFFYLLFRRKLSILQTSQTNLPANHKLNLLLSILFWFCLAGSTNSLGIEVLNRPMVYFILTSISASVIAIQILRAEKNSMIYLVLFEILLVSLSVRASAFYVFPTLPGIDSWTHMELVKVFTGEGSLGAVPAAAQYYINFPVMFLNTATMKILAGVDYKTAMFLGTGLPLLLSTVFVFLIGRNLVNAKVGLLAMLLLNLSDFHLHGSIEIIPMSYGIALFSVILYLLVQSQNYINTGTTALTLLLLFVLILTHTISAFIMLCFISFFFLGIVIHRWLYKQQTIYEKTAITSTLLVLFATAMLAYWMSTEIRKGGSFFAVMIRSIYVAITADANFLGRPIETAGLGSILNIGGFLLLTLFSILGCFIWLSGEHQSRTKVRIVIALVAMMAIQFTFPVFGIAKLEPTRWFYFNYIILSVVAAVSISAIISQLGYRRLQSILLTCVIGGISFFMITNPVANTDSPVYAADLNPRLVYSNAEVDAAGEMIRLFSGTIVTDYRYADAVIKVYMHRGDVSSKMLDEKQMSSHIIIWRNVLSERPGEVTTGDLYAQSMSPADIASIQKSLTLDNLIYTNRDVKVFLPVESQYR